jgi:phosphate uptake regulator
MKRKLIQHGMSSLTISLPKKWVDSNNLTKGDEIDVDSSSRNLIVSAEKSYKKKKIDIDVSNSAPMIKRMIGACFKSGYDEINIRFKSHEELKVMQDLIREQFAGFEIIRQTKNNLTIKNLSKASFEEFENTLKRFLFVVDCMASDLASAVKKDDFEWMMNISLQKIESDKFADYCRRAINMGAEIDNKRTAPLYTIIEQIEKVVDRYNDLCLLIAKKKLKLGKETILIISEIVDIQKMFHSIFSKFDIKKMPEFGRKKQKIQNNIDKALLRCKKEEIKILDILDRILNLIFDLNGPLMAVHI